MLIYNLFVECPSICYFQRVIYGRYVLLCLTLINHKKLLLFNWIISSFRPWIAPQYPPSSLHRTDYDSSLLYSLYRVVTTAGYMLTVWRSVECSSPERVIGREISLVGTDEGDEKGFHGRGFRCRCMYKCRMEQEHYIFFYIYF